VIAISVVWLVFELSIFRDHSFSTPWIYVGVMVAIGLLYFAYMLITRRSFEMPGPLTTPEEQLHESGDGTGELLS
jgi:predicted membrane protein